jgi:hypothetical protein
MGDFNIHHACWRPASDRHHDDVMDALDGVCIEEWVRGRWPKGFRRTG